MTRQYRTSLVIDGNAEGGIRAVHATRSELRGLDAANQRSARNSRTAAITMAQGYDRMRASIINTRTAAIGLASAVVLRKTIGDFAAFEKGLIGVGKTTNITGDELQALGDDIQEMSRRVPVATTRLLEIAQSAGQLGVKGRGDILRFTETVAKLGTATDLAGEEGATAFARLLTVTGEPIKNVDRLGAAVVALGNNYAATESEIAQVATNVGQSTAAFKLGAANVVGISTALKAVGVNAEAGGTAVGKAFRKIDAAVRNGGKQMATLERITGETAESLREAFESGNKTQVFQSFAQGLGRINDQGGDVNGALESMGLSAERVSRVLTTMATRSDLVGRAIADANRGWDENIALNKEAAIAAESFSSQMQLVQNAADEAGAELGRVIAPSLLDGMDNARTVLIGMAENMDLVVASGGALASVFAGRVVGSLATTTQGLLANRAATVAAARADDQAAAASARYAQGQVLTSEAVLARAKYQAALARGTANEATALKALDAAQRQALRSRLALTEATYAASAASTAYARTTGIAATAARGLSAAMALVGGPLGAAVLAAGAIYAFRDELGLTSRPAEELKNRVSELTGELDKNTSAAERNTIAWKNNRISSLQDEMIGLKKRAKEAREELEAAQEAVKNNARHGRGEGVPGLPTFGASRRVKKLDEEINAREVSILTLQEQKEELQKALRGEKTGTNTGAGAVSGDQAVAALLNQYDDATVKLNELQRAREKLVAAMGSADPDNLDRYKRAIAEIDEQIESLGKNQKTAAQTATQTASASERAAKRLQQAYEQTSGNLTQQIALFDKTGQVAQTRYDIEQGALRNLSAARKQNLLQMSAELDRLNAQRDAVRSLFPEWEKLKQASQLRESVSDLPPEMQAFGKRRAAQIAAEGATEGLPGGQGLDPEFNGPFGEAERLENDRAKYEEKYRQRLESFQAFARTHKGQKAEADAAIEALEADHQTRMQQYDKQTAKARRAGYEDLYGSLTDIVGTFAGRQSGIYSTMFAAEKAYHLASVIMSSSDAIAKAWASAPFPANLPAVATTAAETGVLSAAVSSVSLGGQAHDGIDEVPREGTWLLDRGERVIDRRTNVDLKQYLAKENSTGGNDSPPSVSITMPITVEGKPGMSDEDARRQGARVGEQVEGKILRVIDNEFRSGGRFSNVKRPA